MSNHVNIENDEITIPHYAVHKDGLIAGFFGQFRFLSNFYPLKNGVVYEGLFFPSVENAYQSAKIPPEFRHNFVDISAGASKKLAKKWTPWFPGYFNSKKWNKKKYDIMYDLVKQKFIKNDALREMLWLTNGYKLEERNSWGDQDWGTNEEGIGENNLGKILMTVREHLKIGPEDQF